MDVASTARSSTTEDLVGDPDEELRRAKAGRWVRRAAIAAVAVFVVGGAAGVFGPRTGTRLAASGDYSVELDYQRVTRGGLASTWRLTVSSTDGRAIDAPITIETTAAYLAAFDQNALVPEPDATSQTPDRTTWTFEPSGEPALTIRLDIRTQPDAKWTRRAVTTVAVGDVDVAELHYSTWIAP